MYTHYNERCNVVDKRRDGVVYVTLVAAGLTRCLFYESDVVTLQEGRGANEMGQGTAQVGVLQTEQVH